MSTVSTEIKKEEALKRMKSLGLSPEVINDFIEGTINMSIKGFNVPIFDFLIKELILRTNLKNPYIYYLIEDDSDMISVLYVSDYIDDWELENKYIEKNIVYPYVINRLESSFSEVGAIEVKNINGCLIRIS